MKRSDTCKCLSFISSFTIIQCQNFITWNTLTHWHFLFRLKTDVIAVELFFKESFMPTERLLERYNFFPYKSGWLGVKELHGIGWYTMVYMITKAYPPIIIISSSCITVCCNKKSLFPVVNYELRTIRQALTDSGFLDLFWCPIQLSLTRVSRGSSLFLCLIITMMYKAL